MPKRPNVFRPRSAGSKRDVDLRRGTAQQRGYDAAWAAASRAHRVDNPLCRYCEIEGRVSAATLTDHLYPHRVYVGVFWAWQWWVSSCGPCHSGMKQAIERQGKGAIDALADRLGLPRLAAEGVGRKSTTRPA